MTKILGGINIKLRKLLNSNKMVREIRKMNEEIERLKELNSKNFELYQKRFDLSRSVWDYYTQKCLGTFDIPVQGADIPLRQIGDMKVHDKIEGTEKISLENISVGDSLFIPGAGFCPDKNLNSFYFYEDAIYHAALWEGKVIKESLKTCVWIVNVNGIRRKDDSVILSPFMMVETIFPGAGTDYVQTLELRDNFDVYRLKLEDEEKENE